MPKHNQSEKYSTSFFRFPEQAAQFKTNQQGAELLASIELNETLANGYSTIFPCRNTACRNLVIVLLMLFLPFLIIVEKDA